MKLIKRTDDFWGHDSYLLYNSEDERSFISRVLFTEDEEPKLGIRSDCQIELTSGKLREIADFLDKLANGE